MDFNQKAAPENNYNFYKQVNILSGGIEAYKSDAIIVPQSIDGAGALSFTASKLIELGATKPIEEYSDYAAKRVDYEVGDLLITEGVADYKKIIHTAIFDKGYKDINFWSDGSYAYNNWINETDIGSGKSASMLRSAAMQRGLENALEAAVTAGCKVVHIPSMIEDCGLPVTEAAMAIMATVDQYLQSVENPPRVFIVVSDKEHIEPFSEIWYHGTYKQLYGYPNIGDKSKVSSLFANVVSEIESCGDDISPSNLVLMNEIMFKLEKTDMPKTVDDLRKTLDDTYYDSVGQLPNKQDRVYIARFDRSRSNTDGEISASLFNNTIFPRVIKEFEKLNAPKKSPKAGANSKS